MSAPAYKLPVLVECAPYKARLTESSCVDRWRKAQGVRQSGKGFGQGQHAIVNAQRRAVLVECVGCKVGKKRSETAGDA